jgi:sugar lactone lactonase YvrE
MRFITFALCASFSVALLSGCSESGPLTTATAAGAALPSSTHPRAHASSGLIYSASGTNSVEYFLKNTGPNNPVAGSISGDFSAPVGMGVDKGGDLYVANNDAENVLVYRSGSTSPSATLNDPNQFPYDVAIAPDGTAYVASISGPMGASGSLVAYAPGASNPTRTLSDEHFLYVIGVALDKNGNVFASYDAHMVAGTASVVEFKAGKDKPTETHIKLGAAGGIGFDNAGHLVALDLQAQTLNVYDAGKRTPIQKLKLPGTSIFFSFNKDSSRLYLADYSQGKIDEYRYRPDGLTLINTITNGMSPSSYNQGIATTPAQEL